MAARRRRSVMLWALAATAGAHGLVVLWLAAQASVLKFRAQTLADHSTVVVWLQPRPAAAGHPRPLVKAPPRFEAAPEATLSGPATIDEGEGPDEPANLAKPVFRDWPHPVPSGADWGRASESVAAPRLALAGGWSDCQHRRGDQDAWAPDGKVKAPCLNR